MNLAAVCTQQKQNFRRANSFIGVCVPKANCCGKVAPALTLSHSPLAFGTGVAKLSNESSMWQLCKEFLLFLKQEKKWWLIPLIVLLLILAAVIIFSGSSVLAPFMYPFM
jgi:hypothetical protein